MIRRTVVLSGRVARQIERIAKQQRRSFSAVLTELADQALRRRKTSYAWIGSGESGLPDLGTNAEKYLGQDVHE